MTTNPCSNTCGTGLWQYFDSDVYTDITVRFSGKAVKAHKVVLASESEFFRKAFEAGFKEAKATSIELHEDDPDAVMTAILFCYGKYDDGYSNVLADQGSRYNDIFVSKESRVITAAMSAKAKVLVTARKYFMPSLVKWVLSDLAKDFIRLEQGHLWPVAELFDVFHELYDATRPSDHPRARIIAIIEKWFKAYYQIPVFKELLMKTPELAVDLVMAFGRK